LASTIHGSQPVELFAYEHKLYNVDWLTASPEESTIAPQSFLETKTYPKVVGPQNAVKTQKTAFWPKT
jgi:hypothetical protein